MNCPECRAEMIVVIDEPFGRTYGCSKCKITLDVEFKEIEVSENGQS